MTEASREVGVVVRRRSIDNPWVDQLWSPVMILDEVPATAPWTELSAEADATTYYAGAASIDLFSAETANYRDNLADGAPRIWVVRRPGRRAGSATKCADPPRGGDVRKRLRCDRYRADFRDRVMVAALSSIPCRHRVPQGRGDRAAAIGACRAAGRMRERDAMVVGRSRSGQNSGAGRSAKEAKQRSQTGCAG